MKTEQVKKGAKRFQRRPTFRSIEFKKMVIAEYLSSGLTKEAIQVKYDIKAKSAIATWMRKMGVVDPFAQTPYLSFVKPHYLKKKPPSQPELDNQTLQKKIRELETELADEKLRAEMYARAINIAEKRLHIPILKKYDTK